MAGLRATCARSASGPWSTRPVPSRWDVCRLVGALIGPSGRSGESLVVRDHPRSCL